MKKILFTCLIIVILSLLSIGILMVGMPSVSSYAISKITGHEVHISKIDYKYTDGTIIFGLNDLSVKGKVEGHVKKWLFSIGIKGGFHLKSVIFSDFDLKISDIKGKKGFIPVFAKLLEIKNGKIAYNNHTFVIHKIKINNFKPGTPFTFETVIDNDFWLTNLRASGEGTYTFAGGLGLKGQVHATQLNLNKLSDSLKGKANVNGAFTYTKKEFSLNGPFEIFDYEEKNESFRNVLSVEKTRGNVLLTYAGNVTDIKMSHMLFKGTPINLDLKFEKDDLAQLELGAGFLDLQDIKHYITLDRISKTPVDIWNYLRGGKIKITKFTLSKGSKLSADLDLKNGDIMYGNLHFQNVGGTIMFDNEKLSLSNFKGAFKTSMFHDIAGIIPFSSEKDVKIKGYYAFNLEDVPSLLDLGDLSFKRGETDGTIELGGNKKRGYTLSGTGKLNNAGAIWKRVSANAKGSYTFTNDEITFDPLTLSKGATDITIRGKWQKKFMDLKIKGNLDVFHAKPFLTGLPFEMAGTTDLDVSIQQKSKWVKLSGDIIMDDLSFELPGIVKKKSGIQSKASLTLIKEDRDISVEELLYSLDIINLKLRGNIEDKRTINFDAAMDVTGIERIAPLFFFDSETTKGDLELSVVVRGLTTPVNKLPYINGHARVHNGILRLPWMQKSFKEINLTSAFQGDTFNIKVNNLKFGNSTLSTGTLHIKGLEHPRFSLYINMDNFEYDDLQSDRAFEIPVIYKNSLLANVSGDIFLRTKKIKIGNVTGGNLDIRGVFDDRKLNISELKMDSLEGNMDSHGSIDFSDPLPHIYANGKLNNFVSGLFLESFGGKSQIIEGKTTIYGHMDSSGKTMKALIGDMNGNLTIYSRNGLIKRWNLLSKIFRLLNVYDVFREKSDPAKEGLSYTRLGANFKINNGIFGTKDFLIDSPSMLITGSGNLNMKNSEIDGTVTVSPLVTVDRTIDKIPILRSILKEKDKGFLYVVYNVKGQFEDPDISVSFTNSVGNKTIEILKNILVLPKGMFE